MQIPDDVVKQVEAALDFVPAREPFLSDVENLDAVDRWRALYGRPALAALRKAMEGGK